MSRLIIVNFTLINLSLSSRTPLSTVRDLNLSSHSIDLLPVNTACLLGGLLPISDSVFIL